MNKTLCFLVLASMLMLGQGSKLRGLSLTIPKGHSLKNLIQTSIQEQVDYGVPSPIMIQQDVMSQDMAINDAQTEQLEEIKLEKNADVFLRNSEGVFELVGKEGDIEVQQKMKSYFEQTVKKFEEVEDKLVDELNKKEREELQVQAPESDDADDTVIVKEDASMANPQVLDSLPDVVQQAPIQYLNAKISNNILPYKTQFLASTVQVFNSVELSMEEMMQKGCIFLFSECDFKGKSLSSCPDSPSNLSQFSEQIASAFIPEGASLTMFHSMEQRAVSLRQTISCLNAPISFIITPSKLELRFPNGKILDD